MLGASTSATSHRTLSLTYARPYTHTMTVAALIKVLQKADPKAIAILSSDSEGNSHSPVAAVSTCLYEAETTWCGSLVEEGGKPAVVLYPTN